MSMQVFPTAPSPTVTHLMNLVTELAAAAALIALTAAAARASHTYLVLLLPNQSWLPAAVCLHKCSHPSSSFLFFTIIYHLRAGV